MYFYTSSIIGFNKFFVRQYNLPLKIIFISSPHKPIITFQRPISTILFGQIDWGGLMMSSPWEIYQSYQLFGDITVEGEAPW